MIRLTPPTTPAGRVAGARTPLLAALVVLLAAPAVAAARAAPPGERAFLGISSRSLTGKDARRLDLDRRDGALVQKVYPGTAADDAGLEQGDVIVEFDGEKVFDDGDLGEMIRDHEAGDEVSMEIVRDGKKMTVHATLGSREDWGRDFSGFSVFSGDNGDGLFTLRFGTDRRPQLGVYLMELNSQLAEYFGVEEERGVLVTRVIRKSPAEAAGIRAGDVILRIAGVRVVQSGDISDALEGREGGTVAIEVMRKGSPVEITVDLAPEEDGSEIRG